MRPAPLSRQALTVAGVLTAFAVCLPNARACPYIIRDSGYIVHEPRPFHLYVFVDHTAPGSAELSQRVHKAAATEFADANVELKLVPVEADEPTDAVAYYQRAGSPKLPAAVLVSARDDVLLLPGFGAAWSNERSLRQALRRVASSPARQRIIANLVRPWCVVLLGVGTEARPPRAPSRSSGSPLSRCARRLRRPTSGGSPCRTSSVCLCVTRTRERSCGASVFWTPTATRRG